MKKPLHYIPPRYLWLLGLKKAEIHFRSTTNAVGLFVVSDGKNGVGSIYESTEVIKESENLKEVIKGVKERLEFRKMIKVDFLPIISDYQINEDTKGFRVNVLLESLGKSISDRLKDNLSDSISLLPSWFLYAVRFVSIMNKCGLGLNFISPETIFLSERSVKFLDLDLVITNNPIFGVPNTSWRASRWNRALIDCPKAFYNESKGDKLQLYFLAISFFTILDGDEFIKDINKALNNPFKMVDLLKRKTNKLIEKYEELKKFLLVMSSPIVYYPSLCPTSKEIYELLKKFETTSYKEMKLKLKNKCANCGKQLDNIVSLANCLEALICQNCLKKAPCKICTNSHLLDIDFESNFLLSINNKPWKFKPHAKQLIVGSHKESHIGTFLHSFSIK